MKQKVILDKLPAMPGMGVIARLKWTITPPEGRVLLYRTETDPTPQELNGPSGEGSIDIVEPRTIYYELLPGMRNIQMAITGCKLQR